MANKTKRIAVIGGAGKMGRWLAAQLKHYQQDVVIADKDYNALRAVQHELGVDIAANNIEASRGADFILLSVPPESFEDALADLRVQIQPWQVVIDVTSVKVQPVTLMHELLPKTLVLGAHPLFGPGASSLDKKNIVLTPTTDAEASLAKEIEKYLEKEGANVSLMTPAAHDEMMSLVLGLSHFIALVTADTLLDAGELHPMAASGSSTYKVLLTLIESVLSEDPELYASIQMGLPDVTRFERLFFEKTGEWAVMVASKNRSEFTRRMKALKAKLTQTAPGFEKSYEKMYRIVEGL